MGAPAEKKSVAAAAPTLQAIPSGPQLRFLKRGELLFAEGENSRAMYLLKKGMIRLYKKKGDSSIELDTVHSGQVLGELAFLDGNPRSASGEALTDCELIEISGPLFQQVLTKLPDWLKILMKTIVGRLRSASTRIRQLESSSTAYLTEKDGKRQAHYVYLSTNDCLKICTSLLLVGVRNSTMSEQGADVRLGLLQRYANQVMSVPVAKITSMLDVLSESGVVSYGTGSDTGKVFLADMDFLEKFIAYVNEENLLEPSKRHDVSARGYAIMSAVSKHLARYPVEPKTGSRHVNVHEVRVMETPTGGREPFRMEEFQELVKLGYGTVLQAQATNDVRSMIVAGFELTTRFQRVLLKMHLLNEEKNAK
jgi:CRP/FNR family cyclic AMP-dependent transcriptional regulator